MHRINRKKGFTLVEILIVVVILGILATIVIPQFTNASTDARKANLVTQLQSLRKQIQVYKAQHNDKIPDLVSDWTALTASSTVGSTTVGPYLSAVPVNPLNNYTGVADGDGSAPPMIPCGFIYDFAGGSGTGNIIATNADAMTAFSEQR